MGTSIIPNSFIFVTLIVNTIISLYVLFKDFGNKTNRYYAFFVTFLDLWIMFNFLQNESSLFSDRILEIWLRVDFALAIYVVFSWFLFCIFITKNRLSKKENRKFLIALGSWNLILSLLSFGTETVITDVYFDGSLIRYREGSFFLIYAFFLVSYFISGIYFLIRKIRSLKNHSITYRQILFILIGAFVSIGNGVVINLFLQTFFPISLEISRFGLYGMSILVIFSAYAVLRYKWLNINLIAIELFVIAVSVILFVPILYFENLLISPKDYLFDMIIFLVVLAFGFILLRKGKQEHRMREELLKANERLRSLDELKNKFMMSVTHELKTPITNIKNNLWSIQSFFGNEDPDSKREINSASISVERLTQLVNSILEITAIKDGTFQPLHIDFNCQKIT